MTAVNPEKRPSAEELLNDPFFSSPHLWKHTRLRVLKKKKPTVKQQKVLAS